MQQLISTHEIAKKEWLKHWAGSWSILSSTYFGHQYTQTISKELGTSLQHAVFVSRKNYTTCFLETNELAKFGKELAQKIVKDEKTALGWCDSFKKQTDNITGVISKLSGRTTSQKEYSLFVKAMYQYVPPHIAVKKVVDYLHPETLSKLLPHFQAARLYAEKVYDESEKFVVQLSQKIGEKEKIAPELVRCCLKEEFEEYLKNGKLPSEKVLRERFEGTALLFQNGEYQIVTGKAVEEIEATLLKQNNETSFVKGMTAFAGKAKGIIRVVLDPTKDGGKFKQGEVLVTGMTRPEYLPIMKKAVAVVTDAGGVLSHAAISAREMKIVCVIGTQKATKLFKDGDLVEVDADNGIVRKIVNRRESAG